MFLLPDARRAPRAAATLRSQCFPGMTSRARPPEPFRHCAGPGRPGSAPVPASGVHPSFQSYLAGAIFVRRQGRTAPALPGDVMALEDRFAETLLAIGLDRERQRLEKISQTVEDMFGEVVNADPSDRSPSCWYMLRNQLRTLLVGLEDKLLTCAQIVNAGSAIRARNPIPNARNEIEAALRQLGQ